MNRRFLSVFGFALLVSAVASTILYQFLVARIAVASTQHRALPKIWVAAHQLETGALITEADLKQVFYAGPTVEGLLTDRKDLVGRGVISVVAEGEPIHELRLAPKGGGAGLASLIPVGMRAVALRVNDVVGLAGFVVPGMRVDVIVSGDVDTAGKFSRTVLQDIEVLSAGKKIERHVDGRPEEAQVVNLLVNPADAEVLSLAGTESRVQLVLRNPLDHSSSRTKGASLNAIFGVPARAPAPAPVMGPVIASAPRPAPVKAAESIEVFSGVQRSDQAIQ